MISENDETTSQGIENDESKEDDKNENRQKETKLQSGEYKKINKSSKARAFTKGKINNLKELQKLLSSRHTLRRMYNRF
jgi:hypothetical protein